MTALFGGTFDPPHLGHFEAVHGLFKEPGIKEVLILPSASPPQKEASALVVDRIEMTKICFEARRFPGKVKIDLREVLRASGEPTYTFDTLQEVRKEIPNLAFVIGTDQLKNLHTWYRFPDVLRLAHWIVLCRKPDGESVGRKVLSEWEASSLVRARGSREWWIAGSETALRLVETGAPNVSSTRIREEIARSGTPPEKELMPDVVEYLKQRRIYGTKASN